MNTCGVKATGNVQVQRGRGGSFCHPTLVCDLCIVMTNETETGHALHARHRFAQGS